MIISIRHSNGDISQSIHQHNTTCDPNNGQFQNLRQSSLLWLPTSDYRIYINEDHTKRDILKRYHNHPTAGHPGRDATFQAINQTYWWAGMRKWITEYIKGCTACQQNKNLTHRQKTPLYHISPPPNAQPLEVISMDLITQLLKSNGKDAILTIIDHGCTRAATFLPCTMTITAEGVAQMYMEHIYRWFGLPSKIISDWDPQFTSLFTKALCKKLHI